jgi:two-component system response regulator PilR (NtrC family)
MKNGAFDYISKPFNVEEILSVIRSATARNSSKAQAPQLSESFPEIIGQSREMLKIFDMIRRVAPTPANVLIYGESGTGKELVAQAIHNHSKVAFENFVPITCSAIPEDLMESELFGHVKGSFTGAIGDKPGLFNEADKGTAFLDEIGELTPIIQTKLLRVLQEREIKAVGGTKSKPINVRIIAATNKVLEEEIRAGRFREDLFYRLAVVPIRVPPLRERKGDVPLLVDFFLKKYSQLLGKEVQEISSYAMQVLMNYDFPGNVRELENIIERGVALESSNIILPESLTLGSAGRTANSTIEIQQSNPLLMAASSEEELYDLGLEKVIENLEKRLISHALEKTNHSKMKAADLLQVSFRSLRYKVKKYDLD